GEPPARGVYRVPASARAALRALHAGADHERMGSDLVVRLTAAEASELRSQGISIQTLFASEADESRAIREQPDVDQFHTFAQMESVFIAAAAAHPAMARFVVLGQSVQNRDIFALHMSDHPDQVENEPTLVFWGGIHGNEYGGAEVSGRYALYL